MTGWALTWKKNYEPSERIDWDREGFLLVWLKCCAVYVFFKPTRCKSAHPSSVTIYVFYAVRAHFVFNVLH